jgi:hypothetical protein
MTDPTVTIRGCNKPDCRGQKYPDGSHFHFTIDGEPVEKTSFCTRRLAEYLPKCMHWIARNLPASSMSRAALRMAFAYDRALELAPPMLAAADDDWEHMLRFNRGAEKTLVLLLMDYLTTNGLLIIFNGEQQTQQPPADALPVRERGWDIYMPGVCPAGCHQVYLYRDGRPYRNLMGRVRDASEARNLINGWADDFGIRPDIRRNLRTRAVETTSLYNAELARSGRTG